MNFILKQRIKFYTKKTLRFLNLMVVALVIIIGIAIIKYKPIYEVKLDGTKIGYVNSKKEFENTIVAQIKNYKSKNVYNVEIQDEPEYALKLVSRSQETNEGEIVMAMQKDMIITYKYFDIYVDGQKASSVDTLEKAQEIVDEIKQKGENAEIIEAETQDEMELPENTLETAKEEVYKELNLIQEEKIREEKITINGIKLAVLPVQGTITSRYGVSSRIRSSDHTGLDIATTKGTPIKVVASGTVTCAKYSGSYGNIVKVDHGNGVETWYAHANKINVTEGQTVEAGDIIAEVGSTGNSTGPHLHFEIRINGEHINPEEVYENIVK